MFTGLVTDIGTLVERSEDPGLRLKIRTRYDTGSLPRGASLACDGVWLIVVDTGPDWFAVEASDETQARTTIGGWQPGKRINLERPLRVGDELGGHIVAGHVDGTARVVEMTPVGGSIRMLFEAPEDLARYIAAKGSVALNGVSLTVNEVAGRRFAITMIPHTRSVTNWDDVQVGDAVNIEIDTMARYVARLQEWQD
ncbi:riboflavin synthase [Pseudooceanicola nanhaiensis]|uniref:riboflavin synthase n=1 Tax=Pseudooceanicola nanhaiensis TaxID=375761 RepID=UPI001CD30A1A|nr:riboflavin synthase [Pseudooceanicola nanhaiensis]MCA0919598.1 riboflavin synthase [Pseudooceanicola nanhaiensis]